ASASQCDTAKRELEHIRQTERKMATTGCAPAAEASSILSRSSIKVPSNLRDGTFGNAATGFYKVASGLAHPRGSLGIAQELNPRHARVFRTLHLYSRSRRREPRRHFRKVFHGRTKHW